MIVEKKPERSYSTTVMYILAYLDRYGYPVLILIAGALADFYREMGMEGGKNYYCLYWQWEYYWMESIIWWGICVVGDIFISAIRVCAIRR